MTPGLSVLIPVFNCNVHELVDSLLAQQEAWPGPVEILLLDDGSHEDYRVLNRPLAARPGVSYRELPRNVGRAAIRNQLARAAQYEWLLLLDNDSQLPDAHFLSRYAAAQHRAPVLVGGTAYSPVPPAEAALRLRWLYGRNREARPAAERQRAPHAQLAINNALVQAAVLARFPFDEELTGYGHEDTLFGAALAQADVSILHLDNPVLHTGLEPAEVFLQKSEQAVRNLVRVQCKAKEVNDSRLLQTARRLHRVGLAAAASGTLAALEPALRRGLLGPRPRLTQLDLLKLYWLLVAQRQQSMENGTRPR